jgi:hypothetical protein
MRQSIASAAWTAAATPPVDSILDRTVRMVRAEYREMPGLGLTLPQAARFFALTPHESERVLAQLMAEGLVFRDMTGVYRRHG